MQFLADKQPYCLLCPSLILIEDMSRGIGAAVRKRGGGGRERKKKEEGKGNWFVYHA